MNYQKKLKKLISTLLQYANVVKDWANKKIEYLCDKASIPKKYVIISFVAFLGIGVFLLAYHPDKSATMVCESTLEYNQGIGLSFVLDKDGETIKKIIKKDTVTPEFIKQNLPDADVNESLQAYKDNISTVYTDITEKYKDISWFKAELKTNDDKIETIYTFDVSNKDFDYKKGKEVIESFSLEYYYDAENKKFTYQEDEFLKNTPLGTIPEVKCQRVD